MPDRPIRTELKRVENPDLDRLEATLDEGQSLEDMVLNKADYPDERIGQLTIKQEEYLRRIEMQVNPKDVRDAVFKLAVIDLLVGTDEPVEYIAAYDLGMDYVEKIGRDTLIDGPDEEDAVFDEFHGAYSVIKSYLETGNENIQHGSGLPDL